MNSHARLFFKRCADWLDIYLDGVVGLLRGAAPECHGRLLDVGCGSKPYLSLFAPYVTEYIGIENRATLESTHDAGAGAADVYYEGDRLPFEDASFDVTLSVSVLEHTPQPEHLFAEMARVLKPGGTMLQHVPFSFRLHEEPHDFFRYTPHALRMYCANNGLEVRSIVPQGSLWSVIAHKLTTFLALRVARAGGFAQRLGKLGMERTQTAAPRYWTFPLVFPLVAFIVAGARALEAMRPVAGDHLAFFLVATKPQVRENGAGAGNQANIGETGR